MNSHGMYCIGIYHLHPNDGVPRPCGCTQDALWRMDQVQVLSFDVMIGSFAKFVYRIAPYGKEKADPDGGTPYFYSQDYDFSRVQVWNTEMFYLQECANDEDDSDSQELGVFIKSIAMSEASAGNIQVTPDGEMRYFAHLEGADYVDNLVDGADRICSDDDLMVIFSQTGYVVRRFESSWPETWLVKSTVKRRHSWENRENPMILRSLKSKLSPPKTFPLSNGPEVTHLSLVWAGTIDDGVEMEDSD